MKITLLLGTAAIMVLVSTVASANSMGRSIDRDRSVDNQQNPPLISILGAPVPLPMGQRQWKGAPVPLPMGQRQWNIPKAPVTLLLADSKPWKQRPRQVRRLSVGGVWDTTEGELTLNQGNLVSDSSTDGQHLEQSAAGGNILGIYDKRGGSIRGQFVSGSDTEVEGYWMQDYSDVKCGRGLPKPSLTSYWVLSKPDTNYWGYLRLSFKRDGSFTGVYGYCGEEPQRTWTGQKK